MPGHRRQRPTDPPPGGRRPSEPDQLHPINVGALPVGGGDEVKQTNEIGRVIPVLEALDLTGKTITTNALLTQRKLAEYLLEHDANDVFTVKDNPPTLLADIRVIVESRGQPDFREPPTLAHGRIEQRAIWTTTRLNAYLTFPGVGQAFVIERPIVAKKTGKTSTETVYGVTRHPRDTVAATLQRLARNVRLVFDYLGMTENSRRPGVRLARGARTDLPWASGADT